MKDTKYIFDLDGTVTSIEILPLIAKHFEIEEKIDELLRNTLTGRVPFVESFIKRVKLLSEFPAEEIDSLIAEVPLYTEVLGFIRQNSEKCVIVTENLQCWVQGLCMKIGCEYHTSYATVKDGYVDRLKSILKKENVVQRYKNEGYRTVFIGEGNNDLEGMREADVSISSGITHDIAVSVLGVTDYVVYTEESLCRQLNQLL